MRILFLVIPLALVVLVFLFLFFYKRYLLRREYNLFDETGGNFFVRNSFLKGVLQSLIFGQNKRKSDSSGKEIGFSLEGESRGRKISASSSNYINKGKEMVHNSGGGISEEAGNGIVGGGGSLVSKNNRGEELDKSRKKLENAIKNDSGTKKIKKITNQLGKKGKISKETFSSSEKKSNSSVDDGGGKNSGAKGAGSGVDPKKVLEELKKTDLGLILDSLKKEQYSFLVDKLVKLNFKNKKEFVKTLLEELVNLLLEASKELNFRASKIRKSGKQIKEIDLKLMTIPLKIKLFEATYAKKDFSKVVSIMEGVDKSLKPYEVVLKEKEEEKNIDKKKKDNLTGEKLVEGKIEDKEAQKK